MSTHYEEGRIGGDQLLTTLSPDGYIVDHCGGTYGWTPDLAGIAWRATYREAGALVNSGVYDTLLLTVGISGSGKSTFLKELTLPAVLDGHKLPGNILAIDAMWKSDFERAQVVNLLKGVGIEYAVAVYFETPLQTCIDRQTTRDDKTLSTAAVERQHRTMRPPQYKEGFDLIITRG